MKINLNKIINNKKIEIEKSIKEKEQELDSINKAYEELAEFLLENGYETKDENDDLLSNVIDIIDKLKENLVLNQEDIKHIEESMKSLENIKTHLLDNSVTDSLKSKIKEINDEIDYNNQKILYINEYIEVLEEIKSACPICKSKNENCSLCSGKEVSIKDILKYEDKPKENKEVVYKEKEIKVEKVKVEEMKEEVKVIKEELKETPMQNNHINQNEKTYVKPNNMEQIKVDNYRKEHKPQNNYNQYQQNIKTEQPQNIQYQNQQQYTQQPLANNKPNMVTPIVVEPVANQNQQQYQNYQNNNSNYNNNNQQGYYQPYNK